MLVTFFVHRYDEGHKIKQGGFLMENNGRADPSKYIGSISTVVGASHVASVLTCSDDIHWETKTN